MVDLDIDIWRYGRNPAGRLEEKYLKAGYPHVLIENRNIRNKATNILLDHFTEKWHEKDMWLLRLDCIYFQNKEDAELFRALLYIY